MKMLKYSKPSDYGGFFLKPFYRFLGILIAKLLAKTPVTPNQVTIFRAFLSLPMLFFLSIPQYNYLLIGGVLVFFTYLLDWVDGALARMKNQESKLGIWLSNADNSMIMLAFLGLSIGAYLKSNNVIVIFAGFISVIALKFLQDITRWYKELFSFSGDYLKKQQKRVLIGFFYGDHFIISLMILACFINQVTYLLYFTAIYGVLCTAGVVLLLYINILKNKSKE